MASHLGSSHADETRVALQLEAAVKLTECLQHAALPGTVKRALQRRCVDQVLALVTAGNADADKEHDHTDAIGCLDVALARVAESKGHHGILSITDAKSWLRAFGETGKQAATLLGKVAGNRNQQAHPTLNRFLATLKLVQHENAPDRAVAGHIATGDTADCTTETGSTAGHGSWRCVPPGAAPLVASPAAGSECGGGSDDNSGMLVEHQNSGLGAGSKSCKRQLKQQLSEVSTAASDYATAPDTKHVDGGEKQGRQTRSTGVHARGAQRRTMGSQTESAGLDATGYQPMHTEAAGDGHKRPVAKAGNSGTDDCKPGHANDEGWNVQHQQEQDTKRTEGMTLLRSTWMIGVILLVCVANAVIVGTSPQWYVFERIANPGPALGITAQQEADFNAWDVNQDGSISWNEIRDGNSAQLTEQEAKMLVSNADTNQDGSISQLEFVADQY